MLRTVYNTLLNHTPEEKKTYKILLVAQQHTGGVEYYRMIKPNNVLRRYYPEFHVTKVNAIHPAEDLDGRQIIKKEGEPDVEFAFRINDDYLKSFDLIHFCRGIALKDGDEVVSSDIVSDDKDKDLLVVMANGYGKRTALNLFKKQKRGGSGIKAAKVTGKTGEVVGVSVIKDTEELIVISKKGQVIRVLIKKISRLGRATQGVRIMALKAGDKIASVVFV